MKKGIAQRTLLLLIILLATAAVLFPIVGNAADIVKGYVDGGVCGASAVAASVKLERFCVAEVQFPAGLSCPRRNIEVGQASYLSFDGERETLSGVNPSPESVNRLLADETLDCWKKLGNGQIALFPEIPGDPTDNLPAWIPFIKNNESQKTGCHICSEIYFSQPAGKIPVDYLGTLQATVPGEKYTYLDKLNNDRAYCQNSFGDACWSGMEQNWDRLPKLTEIDTSKTYAVLMIRRGFEICEGDDTSGELSMFTYVVPHDELNTVCDWVVT